MKTPTKRKVSAQKKARDDIKRPVVVKAASKIPGLNKSVISLHDSWVAYATKAFYERRNAAAIKAFEENKPALTPVQERVLGELKQRGVSIVGFNELFGEETLLPKLTAAVDAWLQSPEVQAKERAYAEDFENARFKDYLVQQNEPGAQLSWDDTWLKLGISDEIMNIGNSYLGMTARIHHINLWDSIALENDRPDLGAQRWHRDPADIKLLKAFLYFSDVDDRCGPLQYVPNSRLGEKYGGLWPARVPFDGSRPPPEEFDAKVPASEVVSCTVPKGTIVFADTSGFHRGGRAEARNRICATWAFSSQAALWPRKFRVDASAAPADLSPAARYALFERPA
jgi:hypothetical protein